MSSFEFNGNDKEVTAYLIRRNFQDNDLIEAIKIEKAGEPKKQEDGEKERETTFYDHQRKLKKGKSRSTQVR